jgi:hypothetical protein
MKRRLFLKMFGAGTAAAPVIAKAITNKPVPTVPFTNPPQNLPSAESGAVLSLDGKGGVFWKAPEHVKAASYKHTPINEKIYKLDGIEIEPNDKILVMSQIDSSENGVYKVNQEQHLERLTTQEHQQVWVRDGYVYSDTKFINTENDTWLQMIHGFIES